MMNSIARGGGNPGKSFGNTSTKSRTTGTSSILTSVLTSGSTIAANASIS
ncbi:hypothetical protein Scep_021650 [Stephania cephalantha]|uniref:Uncharacterized protein n=1 Tax=Stephania cephalantha TaxID=152367 RepID=A0AAP0I1K1_9MAGN